MMVGILKYVPYYADWNTGASDSNDDDGNDEIIRGHERVRVIWWDIDCRLRYVCLIYQNDVHWGRLKRMTIKKAF